MTARVNQKYALKESIVELLKKHFEQNPDRIEITALTLARQLCNEVTIADLKVWRENLERVTARDEKAAQS